MEGNEMRTIAISLQRLLMTVRPPYAPLPPSIDYSDDDTGVTYRRYIKGNGTRRSTDILIKEPYTRVMITDTVDNYHRHGRHIIMETNFTYSSVSILDGRIETYGEQNTLKRMLTMIRDITMLMEEKVDIDRIMNNY